MSKEPEDIILRDFQKGIADSPHLGWTDIRNADLYTIPGIARVNRGAEKGSSTTVTDQIRWIVKHPGGNFYALGDAGKLYKSSSGTGSWSHVSGNTTTSSSANGLAVWKDHIFVARDSKLDVLKCSDDTWYNDWQTLTTDTDWHPMLVGQDDILYIGNGSTIASVDGFVAGGPPTATFNASALDLPSGYRVKCMTELGKWLMIGTIKGLNAYGGDRGADIFPWDRSSDTFELPLHINDFGVHQLVTVGNVVYAVVGYRGSIYITNNSTFRLLRRLPESLLLGSANIGTAGTFLNFFPGAIMHFKNRIYFGVSSGTTGANIADGLGVWSIGEDGSLVFENMISTGTMDADTNLIIGALCPIGVDQYAIGWVDNADEGIDAVNNNRYFSPNSYATSLTSQLFKVGTTLRKRTFQQVEFYLAKPLATDQAIRISYRINLNTSFTVLGTFTFATVGAVLSWNAPAPITDAEYLQIKIEIDTTASTTPELKEILLR